ncbi:muscle-specific protein 300 kDa isoform X12 [Cylas formicarius]|uniref:muscle-specific protein 300 kDa isoform X12 n=1 Tax=Cylas formicarius TaxID=197179 RepID=UPI00295893FD|nr:muscle-specific protein 300 kDa isoform X12 [Cylas formicarius]
MSASGKDPGEGPKRPPESPQSPSHKKLRETVSFYEKVWTGDNRAAGTHGEGVCVDVEELEKKLAEERSRHFEESALEKVSLRHTPQASPRRDVQHSQTVGADGSFQETFTSTTQEGDLSTGARTVKFEKVTVRKTVRQITSSSTSHSIKKVLSTSRTPSEEKIDDSAYVSQSNGNFATSKTSSQTSLTGKFSSEESLRRTPSKERLRDEWDSNSSSSKVTSSSSEWYNEYRTQSIQSGSSKLEYVRSKSQYEEHIDNIRDEQERVQKKTFVNWINSYLSKRVPPLRIDNLIEDLRDGTRLLALLEVLSGERLPVERGRVLRRPHFLSNANTALQFLASKRIKLVNINASDLVDGRPPVVLGLIWTIILYFQIEENSRALEYLARWGSASSLESAGTTSSKDKWKQGARKTLLNWVSNALPDDSGVEVKDFGASWRDGIAFLALIDAIKKNLVNIAAMKKASNKARLETAFDVAETELGIPKILDPEDVDVPKPDERSIMTYVAQFLHRYPEPKSTGPDAIAAIQEQFGELLSWLLQKTQHLEHLEQTHSHPLSYETYLAVKSETDNKELTYNKLRTLMESQSALSFSREGWSDITRLWEKLRWQLFVWLWHLDSRLPGEFKEIGEWVAKAERMIYFDEIPTLMNEETATIISRKLEEHKAFFADLPNIQQKFSQLCQTPLAREVPSEQLSNMAVRLSGIPPKAAQRRVRLKFLEHKCCLIAFLQLTETKLKQWTAKYGRVDKVVQLLEQYRNFVSKNHIFQEFNKAFRDMQAVIEEYKRDGDIDKREIIEIDKFMRDTADRWKNVSMELRCVQSMLEEVVAYWRRWDSLSAELENWLSQADKALHLSEDDKMEFFQDISVWKDKYQLLGETVSFLIATCEDSISLQLREAYQNMTDRWNTIYPQVNQYSHAGDILRNRKDFRSGVEVLSNWLRKAEETLNTPSLGSTERICKHRDNLMNLQSEVEEIENLFKNISKAFQSLIQDLSREEVDKMMTTLKQEKEALVKIRALIPSQIHLFNQLLIQQESLESGQKEINGWLDKAEALLSTLTLEADKEQLKEQIDKVKQFFTRTLYYKSMLESKNKVMHNIVNSVDQTNNPDVVQMTENMELLNDRFAYVTQNEQMWEQRLQEALRCWHNFTESQRVISTWLNQAEKLISEKRIDSKEIVEEHKNFFESVNERWIHNLVQSAQDLCNCLPKELHAPITSSVHHLQNKWKEVLSFAPLHLMRLEFRLDENTFNYYVNELEREIQTENIMITKQENIETIIIRHREFFSSKGPLAETHRSMQNLENVAKLYSKNFAEDKSIEESVEKAKQQWQNINIKIGNIQQQLEKIPEKWEQYHGKFNEMVEWMDTVDSALKNILTEVTSSEEFDKEIATFKSICQEADSKREDMKWLVQTLDSLASHSPDDKALAEQKNLEKLIVRYKNLIPSLEITMTKTETLSKCYTYRREVRQICELLRRVRDQSEKTTVPFFEKLDDSVRQQEQTVSHLDEQRPLIMTLLHKGKELTRDIHAPSFVADDVKTLETGWTETYDESVERLHKLVSTHQVYTSYKEQRNELKQLLERAEKDLQTTGATASTTDLLSKQQLVVHLRDAREGLQPLKELSAKLSENAAEPQRATLNNEIEELERRLETTTSNVQEQIAFLQQCNTKISTIHTKVNQLKSWSLQEAPQLLSSVQETSLTPEDRVQKAQKLESEIASKITLLDDLKNEASQVLFDENPEAQRLNAEVGALREHVITLKKHAESQAAILSKDLGNWQIYKSSLQEIVPVLQKAEEKAQSGLSKPSTLEEAVRIQAEAKDFSKECNTQLQKLQNIQNLEQQIVIKSEAPDEVDSIRTRLHNLQETSTQWNTKLEKVVNHWLEFDKNVQRLENWTVTSEQALIENPVNVNTPNVERLEKELIKLKQFNNEISEQQAKLISLTQSSDSIAYNISPEGAALIKDQVQGLKAKVTNLAESVRAKINDVSDAILARHDFQAKFSDYTNWLENVATNSARLDEVPADKVDSAIESIHILLQEHAEKQPLFNKIYNEVKEISIQASKKETEPLNEEYTNLVRYNQETEHKLHNKLTSLQRWSELLNWHTDGINQLNHIKVQLENENCSPEKLQELINESDSVIESIINWKKAIPTIDSNQVVTILDKQTGLPITAENIVREVEIQAINLKSRLGNKLDEKQKIKSHWNKFNDMQRNLLSELNATKSQLATLKDKAKHSSDLPRAVEDLGKLLEAQIEKAQLKDELRKEAVQLMREDIQNVSVIQNAISDIESHWNKVNEDIKEDKLQLSDIIHAWNEFQESKDRIVTEIGKIDKTLENLEAPNDLIQSHVNADKAKKALEAIKKTKSSLDKVDSKGQTIIKKSDKIPGIESEVRRDLKIVNDVWAKIYEKIVKTVNSTESEATIWRHIEETKNTLLQWLSNQNAALISASETPSDLDNSSAKLAKYREELPSHQRLFQSIPNKYNQLRQFTDGKEIPTVQTLIKLLEDQFDVVEKNAENLESVTSTFGEKEKGIRENIKRIGTTISNLREEIIKCEDFSGDNAKILERLLTLKTLRQQQLDAQPDLLRISDDITEMTNAYPKFSESNTLKEYESLKKRYLTIQNHVTKVEISLSSLLKKFYNDGFSALKRIVSSQKEKIEWCLPEPTSDKYNLQVKLNSLTPIEATLDECENRIAELTTSMQMLAQVESPENIKLLKAEKDHLTLDFNNLKQEFERTKDMLAKNINMQNDYEQTAETISSWLKQMEGRVKSESTVQMDLDKINQKRGDIQKLYDDVLASESEMNSLTPISEQLLKALPESRIPQFVQHLNSRYQSLVKFLSNYLEKLDELEKYNQLYRNSVGDLEAWLDQANEKINSFSEISHKPNQATLEKLKKFSGEKEKGQELLGKAVSHGEALFSGITPENRETIRTELRTLRNNSEALIDRLNQIYKNVENALTQRHSFDDSLQQVAIWINDTSTKLLSEPKLDASLPDKKQTLYSYKVLGQDIALHKGLLQQLQEKIGTFSDADAEFKLKDSFQETTKFSEEASKRIKQWEDYVENHEAYNQAIEKCHDWLSALTAEAASLIDESSEESPEGKLTIVDNLLAQKDEGDQIISSCKQQLESVVIQTAPEGHPPLINIFDEQEKSWMLFLELCTDAKEKLNIITNQYAEVGKLMDSLEAWLKFKENQVKDQSLKNTEDAKRKHLDKLKGLEKEIITKEPEFSNFTEMIKNIETDTKVSQLASRYQSLKKSIKENVNRYEGFVNEHQQFNADYNEFLHWLSDKEEELQDLCHIVGDLNVLQKRQNGIRQLVDEKNQRSLEFEHLVEKGEKLYAHTSPDGRDIIRQQLRNIRTIWDTLGDDLQTAINKLDQCIVQFSDFTATQEQLTKWLKEVEKGMQQHTELKSTLQEKRAQLQNHKIMHQEIMSHQQLVETVCDRAQQLVDQTQDKSLNVYLQSIKQLFLSIVAKSDELLNNLGECVDRHAEYDQHLAAFKDWMSQQNDRLRQHDIESGDRSEISKRIASLTFLKENGEEEGDKLIENLKKILIQVAKSTAPNGVDVLKDELASNQQLLKQYLDEIDLLINKQQATINRWDQFDKSLEELNRWIQDTEIIFRNQELQATLGEKETRLSQYQKQREIVVSQEKEIDQFVDMSHALLNSSGVQKIKPIISQVSARYQNLLGLSKDVINRWQGMVDDHTNYRQKLDETLAWLKPLEDQLHLLQQGGLSSNVEAESQRMQILITEKEKGEHKINSLSLVGERLLPDTAMHGREIVRNEIKSTRERWEKLADGISNQQKLQDAQSMQLSSYQDQLQQTLAWLDSMEKIVKLDSSSWNSVQEVRGKLLKQKTTLQEIIPHKRIIEGITEKAIHLAQLVSNKEKNVEIENNVKSINERYQNLLVAVQDNIKQLENCLDVFQHFYDLLKTQQDIQKQLWDNLNCYVDYSGSKSFIEQRLNKVNEIEDNLPESTIKLKEIEQHVEKRASVLPPRAKEAMQRDVSNLKVDQDKFRSTLVDVKSSLGNRLKQWNDYEVSLERLLAFLLDTECSLKNYVHKSTAEEKQEQLEKYQALITNLRQNEHDFDKMSDDSTELIQSSGDSRISINIQQITSRFQSVQITTKEIVKKCEQALADHKLYNEKYRQCSDWIAAAQTKFNSCQENVTQESLSEQSKALEELLSQKTSALLLLNNTIELGEKLYSSTSPEGRDIISSQLEGLQQMLEALFDGINSANRDIKIKFNTWSEFDNSVQSIQTWFKEIDHLLSQQIILKATLDEKKSQLQVYRNLLHDITSHQQDVVELKNKLEGLPNRDNNIEKLIVGIAEQYQTILKRAQHFAQKYETIVSDHQKYSKAVHECHEWMDATRNTVSLWSDINLERVSLISNLERLKKLAGTLQEERSRIDVIKDLGDLVIPGTIESGQGNIRSQIDASQQEWASLVSILEKAISQLEVKLQQWSEYERLKDQCFSWLRDTDTTLHSIDLKSTAEEKQTQLESLKKLQGEVKAKELEIDQVTEKLQQLDKGLSNRASQISELGIKYQQIYQKVKELTTRWQLYTSSHQDFNKEIARFEHWLNSLNEKLEYCADVLTASEKELELKLETVQGLILNKEDGFTTIQKLVELAQNVLANTAPQGHESVNQTLANLQNKWSNIASKIIETKSLLEDALRKWTGLLEEIKSLDKRIEWLEAQYAELSELQATASEKKTQLERIKTLEEKVRCEKIEVDSLKSQATEVLKSERTREAAIEAQTMLDRFDNIFNKIQKLLPQKNQEYKDHRAYKEAYEEVQVWMTRAQEKVPQLKQRPLGDKLSIEMFSGPLDHLLNKQAQGEVLLENLDHTAQVVIPNTSAPGQETIKNEIRALRESFDRLFKDLKQQREQLEVILVHWRDYKDEFERISDWLQQISILIKNQKIALSSNLEEKQKQVKDVNEILDKLTNGKQQVEKLNDFAKVLLKSPLETHVNNQLQQLNSRYQAELNLAKDVVKKIETNYEQHNEYDKNLKNARNWIDNAREIISSCSEAASHSSKDVLQSHLNQIQDLINRREEGQSLVHATVNCGEKVLRNTRSDGRDIINNEIKEVQSDWERIVKKMSTAKVNLETALLQWADYDSSYNQLRQWISEREAKLQQVTEPKAMKIKKGQTGLSALPIGERKAVLRETGSIVQDIVSFEPMIQSVASKAEDLKQAAPASEISSKYETLSKQAQELYAKQKETVEQHQAFIDAGNDIVQWLRLAKERLGKCSEPTGDKESLGGKLSQIKVLHSELEYGQQKLETALEKGDKACQVADEDDKEIIEEQVALLQEEFDNYVENLNSTKNLLERGIVKWTEYEEQYQDALEWLNQTEKMVQSFNKLQDSLEEKRAVLEQFQLHLQTLFDWQSELDRLNMKAQSLLETCADSRVSNAIMQLSTKYNAILSMAKEIMRRLELYYQEHQQHSTLYQECQDWMDRTRDKLHGCMDIPNSFSEIQNKLQVVKNIRTSIEQGQNKLRYINELKERVIMNTEQTGAEKIQEDTEILKEDMEKLLNEVQDVKNKLQAQANKLEEVEKLLGQFLDWLQDQENQIQFEEGYLNELSEKKAKLEKYKTVQKELSGHNETLDKLKSKLNEDKDASNPEIESALKRFNEFKQQLSLAVSELEVQVDEHDQYKSSYNKAMEWIRQSQLEIQKCSDLQVELNEIIEKESQIDGICKRLSDCDELVNQTIKKSIGVMKTTGEEGKSIIRDEIDQLNTDWEGLQFICNETKKSLSKCKEAWKDLKNNCDSVQRNVDALRARVEQQQNSENNKQEDLEKCRALLTDIEELKPQVENLTDACEILMELSAISWVRDKTVQLQGEYTNLLTGAQGLVSRMEKNLIDHTEFMDIKSELENWLRGNDDTVQQCIGLGDENDIRQKLDKIRFISANLGDGQKLLGDLQNAFAKIINSAKPEKQAELRDDVTNLRNSWDQLNMDLKSTETQLKSGLSRWDEYNEAKRVLESWLQAIEKALKAKPNTKGELSEMRTLLERYKNIEVEIIKRNEDLERLNNEAKELNKWSNKPGVLEQVKELKSRFEQVISVCNSFQEQVDAELRDYNIYQQKLQETEKWLLQVSFQLMAHNSLYITNREQTQEQIVQHEQLLKQIQNYQSTIDDVKDKGYGQIKKYVASAPGITDTIERQLNNVQESFTSLLQTAVQIKNRLSDSLAKFKEYEDALESIMRSLDEYEPIVSHEIVKPVESLEEANASLETAKVIHNKLQNEKSRLAVAVQACEAATASISRPNSPRDAIPPPVPIKELECRARLEDLIDQTHRESATSRDSDNRLKLLLDELVSRKFISKVNTQIDQVQAHLSNLSSSVATFEEIEKQKASLKAWINTQRQAVHEWKNRPIKLRADAAKQEINNMNELLTAIGQRRNQLTTELTGPGTEELAKMLDNLENELLSVMTEKQSKQEFVDQYRQQLQVTNNWFDNLVKRIDVIDKGSGLNCQQKKDAVVELQTEFDQQGPKKVDEVKRLAGEITEIVNNLDSQQVEEQVKSVDRRYKDISKKLQRKMQVLEMTRKGIDDTRNEIEQARSWVKEKFETLQQPRPLGFESRKVDERVNSLKELLKDVENKSLLKDTLTKRVANMTNELEPSEHDQLENSLKNLSTEREHLAGKVKQEIDRLTAAASSRRILESNLEKAKAWLKAKNAEVRKLSGYIPLKTIHVEKEIAQHKTYDQQIKDFSKGDLNDLLKLGTNVLKECDDEDRERLQHLLNEVKDDYENLNQESKQKLDALTDLLHGRKLFESDIEKCINWLKEAEVATSSDIRVSSLDVLEEQLAKYEKLYEDAKRVSGDIEKISEQGKAILPTISESDKIILKETLYNMTDRHGRIASLIQDRTNDLKLKIQQIRDAQAKLAESLQFIKDVQNQLQELNKPVGARVEDVQNLLSSYDRILKDVKASKTKLGSVPGANPAELQDIVNTQDELIRTIEDQIAKLKQMLLLREQYLALITEIMTFITKYTEVVRHVEKSGSTIEEKIKKYDDIVVKIQECEALHASASDKGQQIAADCNVQDRNHITEQLQSLKQSLNNLRKAVEKQRQEHENTAAEYRKLASELEEILDWLHTNEGAVKSRPLLNRDVNSVLREIQNHEVLDATINKYLDKIRKIQENVGYDDAMPGSLQEQLSEANSLLSSLPRELEERSKYLQTNRKLRDEYTEQKEKLYNWVKEAELRLDAHKDGVDFENIFTDLEEHKVFFSTESSIKELVSHGIQQAADKIWPSLTPYEQEELSREQQQHTQLLKNTLNSAKSQRAQLEQDVEIWKDYCQVLDKVKALIARTKFTDEPVSTLAGLHFNIQKITHALNDIQNQQVELDLLQERVAEIVKHADERNRKTIQGQADQVSEDWSSLISNLEGRRDTLTRLAEVWETFEGRWQNFESQLTSIEERIKHIDHVVRSRDHVITTKKNVEDLQSEARTLEARATEVIDLSSSVLLFLSECSPPSAASLTNKLQQLDELYKKLLENLSEKHNKVNQDLSEIEAALQDITRKKSDLVDLKSKVTSFYVFDEDVPRTESDLDKLKVKVAGEVSNARQLSLEIKKKYEDAQHLIPSDIAQELNQLELLSESITSAMDEKDREFKKARTLRSDYVNDVEELQNWIKETELKVQDRSVAPQQLHEQLQQIQSEMGSILDRLENVKRNGQTIIDKSKNQEEQDIVQSTINNLTDQVQQVKSELEDKRQQVGEILDAWQRFLALYQQLVQWVDEKREFLKDPLKVSSLQDVKQKLHDYSNAVKSCKSATKNLSDMAKELEYIGNVTTTGDLPQKMEHAEEVKTDVEAQILKRHALLQETSEEWEQCEKKMKEVRGWIEKNKNSLESVQNKKKPLRDQHALREKMLADIHIQKTKISLSIEKLELHFRSGIEADTRITQSADDLIKELEGLNASIKDQISQLEKAVNQVEEYQLEVQNLRQQIVQVEQQLRIATAPNYKPQDRDQATRDQEAYRERVRALQNKLSTRKERIKLILQRGTPDLEPPGT